MHALYGHFQLGAVHGDRLDVQRARQQEASTACLDERMPNAIALEPSAAADVVGFGSTVELANVASKGTMKYTLVRSTESDAACGKISNESPVGRVLLGARVGEEVTVQAPAGEIAFEVLAIVPNAG